MEEKSLSYKYNVLFETACRGWIKLIIVRVKDEKRLKRRKKQNCETITISCTEKSLK